MKKPVIAALCCLLALGTATAAFCRGAHTHPCPGTGGIVAGRDRAAVLSRQYLMAGGRRPTACRQTVQRTVWHGRY